MESGTATAGRPAIGTTYDGGDPALLERLIEVADYLEVAPDSIAAGPGDDLRIKREVLDEWRGAAEQVAIVAHGIGLSIGSASGWNEPYLRLLDELTETVPLRWHSEHLGYTTVDGEPLGTMLALPRTEQALDLLCERVTRMQDRYPAPFLLENIARMLPDPDGDYDEAGFLNELCKRTGCGLLLDVYNLECDVHNHGLDIDRFLAALEPGTVHELHIAGGTEAGGMKLDVHSRQADPSTLALAARVAATAPAVWGATYEVLPEAVPVLGHDVIVNEVTRLRGVLS